MRDLSKVIDLNAVVLSIVRQQDAEAGRGYRGQHEVIIDSLTWDRIQFDIRDRSNVKTTEQYGVQIRGCRVLVDPDSTKEQVHLRPAPEPFPNPWVKG